MAQRLRISVSVYWFHFSLPPDTRHQIAKFVILLCAIGLCVAQKSCPPDASGVYPRCRCNDFNFIFDKGVCVKLNRDVCPEPAVKTTFGCRCPDPKDFFDDYYWLCRTKLYLPTPSPISTVTPRIYDICPAYTRGKWPNCERIPCGNLRRGDYEPHCTIDIFDPTRERVCPIGEIGTPPFCSPACPQYQARKLHVNCHVWYKWVKFTCEFSHQTRHIGRIRFNNGTLVHPDTIRYIDAREYKWVCEPIPCSKMRGWSGDVMPHCVFTPFCPDEFPGNYPYCNRYATSSTPRSEYLNSRTDNYLKSNSIEVRAQPYDKQNTIFDYRGSF